MSVSVEALEAIVKAQGDEIAQLRNKVSNLERFQVMIMTGLAIAGGMATYFADIIRKWMAHG